MKKQILNLGKALNKAEQRQIKGSNDQVYYPICKCDAHGRKINQPCDGNCETLWEEPPLDLCDVFPDLC